jgi:hypothetical protein
VDWVFDNLQVILVIAGVIAYWINQRRREKAGEEADYDGDGIPENRPVRQDLGGGDPEADERARRIQEEIRRKILARRGESPTEAPPPLPGSGPDPTHAPPPVAGGTLGELLRRAIEEVRDPAAEARAAAEQAARERQRQMLEQMRGLEEEARITRERAASLAAAAAASAASVSRPRRRGSLVGDLRDPESLRRAIVLREVLGKPAGLR